MIIQTGMRTDIPAFYSEWLLNRLREGYVLVRNPYDPSSVTRYSLSPAVVDCLGFCTKDPAPMLPHLSELAAYKQYWFVTITPYGRDIEPNVPPKERVMESFQKLSGAMGVDSVGWRYDPILITPNYTVERHIRDFEIMARTLSGYTKTCVISFIDLYQKVSRNFPEARAVSASDRIVLGKAFAEIGERYDITVKACGEGNELAPYGVDCGGCMTATVWERAVGERLRIPRGKNQRDGLCACVLGSDIGAYDTCGHLCRYCYANADPRRVRENMRIHDPKSPFLTGGPMPGDCIHEPKQESWLDGQMMLEL